MTVAALRQHSRKHVPAGTALCEHCVAKCCRYLALEIDTPESRKEYDEIRWFLLHERATVFTEDDTWYLLVHTACKHLGDDHRCGIYESRPEICREYSTDDCEFDDDSLYDRYFETPEQFDEYMEAVLPRRPGQSLRSPRPAILPIVG